MGNVAKIREKNHYSFSDFVEIVEILREPGGCPWDIEQTHESIRKSFIEETYEVLEAIDTKNVDLLKEELGDVMLQVLMHSRMEAEKGTFTIDDVIDGICKKMVYRHPHVFGGVKADTSEQVLNNWDKLKKVEKQQHSDTDTLKSVAVGMPALMRAQKIQHKATKAGYERGNCNEAVETLEKKLEAFKTSLNSNNENDKLNNMGDVIFSAVNVARFLGIDAEEALTWSTDRFVSDFSVAEDVVLKNGKKFGDISLDELNHIKDSVK